MRKIFSVLALMMFMSSAMLMAASGLASYNRQDISFRYNKSIENVICVQDANDESQWYYVPNKPRLAESKNGDPMMKLVVYQKNSKAGIKNDGGIFQCGINLSLPADAIPALKKEIAKIVKTTESKIKLAPLDMKNAKLMVYNPRGVLLGDKITSPEIGSSFVNECIPLQMNLNNLGIPVTEDLIDGTEGLYAYFLFDYDALTPECSVKVTVNYDKAFEHFSHDSKASKIAKRCFFLGTNADDEFAILREDLIVSGVLEVESISGEEFIDEQIDKLIQPVIENLINDLYVIETPEKIELKRSFDSKKEADKFWNNLSENMALKDENNRKTGEFVYDFRKRYLETRKTIVGGMLNLDNYTETQRREAIQIMDPTYWKNAFYCLPTISKALNRVDEITLSVSFLYKGKQAEGTEKQLVKWNKKYGWLNAKGEECIGLEFPLQYFYEKLNGKNNSLSNDLVFQQNFEVTYMEGNDTKVKNFITNVPVFTNNIPISSPMVSVTYIEFDAQNDYLTWDKVSYKSGNYQGLKSNLTKIGIKLETKNPSGRVSTNLTSKNPSAGLWINNIIDKKTGLYKTPMVSATYTFYNNKLAKAMNTSDKRTIVIEKEDALSEGTSITIMNDDYMPVDKPESYK